jgi:hypothetical protein
MTVNQTSTTAADNSTPARSLPVHSFRLRPDCTLKLDLPDDLTRAEVRRLHLFLKSVVGIDIGADTIDSDSPDFSVEVDKEFPFDHAEEFQDEDDVFDEEFLRALDE